MTFFKIEISRHTYVHTYNICFSGSGVDVERLFSANSAIQSECRLRRPSNEVLLTTPKDNTSHREGPFELICISVIAI